MDGLQPGPMPAQEAGASAPAEGQDWLSGEDVPASPEEQELFEGFIARAYLLVYEDEQVFADVVEALKAGDPVTQLAHTAAVVVYRVKTAADQAGKPLPGDVVLHAGKEVFEDLAELAWKIGAHDFQNDTKALEAAWLKAMDTFRLMSEENGNLDKEAAAADWAEFQTADQDGRLGESMRGMIEKGMAPPAPGPAEEEPVDEPPATGLRQRPKKEARR